MNMTQRLTRSDKQIAAYQPPDWRDEVTPDDIAAIESLSPLAGRMTISDIIDVLDTNGGTSIYLPSGRTLENIVIRRRILADRKAGLDYPAIAARHRVTERHVRAVCDGHNTRG